MGGTFAEGFFYLYLEYLTYLPAEGPDKRVYKLRAPTLNIERDRPTIPE